jgi:hypothetical protein
MYYDKYAEVENLALHTSTRKLQTQYISRGNNFCFHYAATHLVLSRYDRHFLGMNSAAYAVQQSAALFANDQYAVFSIPPNAWLCRPDVKRPQS